MTHLLSHPLALLLALVAAAGMGFAIQQGGTCMVSALDQLVTRGKAGKLAALAECSLWTSALGLLAVAVGFDFQASPGYPLGFATLAGGFLLGTGAWLNGACVFGSIARIGGKDWHYLLTPPGYLLGCYGHARLVGGYPAALDMPAPALATPLLAVLVLASLAASGLAWQRGGWRLRNLWDYRHATVAIGLAFVVLAVVGGAWTYTEALGVVAHGGTTSAWSTAMLFIALLAGALVGGRQAQAPPARLRQALDCAGGGALMGFGASLIPGGNDNLILVGLPGLQPHALAAIAMMSLAIALGLLGARAWSKFALRRTRATC
jgi:toxin CptA